MYKEIILKPNDNLDSAVYTLLSANARGEKVCCNFNGYMLYSDTVSMNFAYMQVCGCTKEDYEKRRKILSEELKQKQNAINNIPLWIEKGKSLIFPDKYDEWENLVIKSANNLYEGLEIEAALEIMTALNNGASKEEVKNILSNQNHSGASESLVTNIVSKFSKNARQFSDYISNMNLKNESDQVYNNIQKINDLDNRKEELDDKQNAINSIPLWIEKGKSLIFPERYDEWEHIVIQRANDLYDGLEIEAALEIMESLNNGVNMEEAKNILKNQNHSGSSEWLVSRIVFEFSKRGPEFLEFILSNSISPEVQALINSKKQENIQFSLDNEHKNSFGF